MTEPEYNTLLPEKEVSSVQTLRTIAKGCRVNNHVGLAEQIEQVAEQVQKELHDAQQRLNALMLSHHHTRDEL